MLYVNPLATYTPSSEAVNAATRQDKALEEFEHLFLYQLLQDMRKTVPKGGLWKNGSESEFYQQMMDDHLAGTMAKSGQFGIAKQMAAQIELSNKPQDKTGASTTPKSLHTASAGIALGGARANALSPAVLDAQG